MSMSLPMDVTEPGASSGGYSGSFGGFDHLNDPDKKNRVATRSMCNLQTEIFCYRSGKDGRGWVHSSGECTYAVIKGRVRWEFLGFCLRFCSCLNVFVFYFFLELLCWYVF